MYRHIQFSLLISALLCPKITTGCDVLKCIEMLPKIFIEKSSSSVQQECRKFDKCFSLALKGDDCQRVRGVTEEDIDTSIDLFRRICKDPGAYLRGLKTCNLTISMRCFDIQVHSSFKNIPACQYAGQFVNCQDELIATCSDKLTIDIHSFGQRTWRRILKNYFKKSVSCCDFDPNECNAPFETMVPSGYRVTNIRKLCGPIDETVKCLKHGSMRCSTENKLKLNFPISSLERASETCQNPNPGEFKAYRSCDLEGLEKCREFAERKTDKPCLLHEMVSNCTVDFKKACNSTLAKTILFSDQFFDDLDKRCQASKTTGNVKPELIIVFLASAWAVFFRNVM